MILYKIFSQRVLRFSKKTLSLVPLVVIRRVDGGRKLVPLETLTRLRYRFFRRNILPTSDSSGWYGARIETGSETIKEPPLANWPDARTAYAYRCTHDRGVCTISRKLAERSFIHRKTREVWLFALDDSSAYLPPRQIFYYTDTLAAHTSFLPCY